jgi:hypothetical protein
MVGAFTVAACFRAVLLAGAAEPADTPANPIPAAINVAITILRIRFSLYLPSRFVARARGGGASKRWDVNAESPHRLVFKVESTG